MTKTTTPEHVTGELVTLNDKVAGRIERIIAATTDDVQARMLDRILAADSLAQLMGSRDTTETSSLIDQPFLLTEISFNPSNVPDGLPYYAVMVGQLGSTGREVTITSGSVQVVGMCIKLVEMAALPVDAVIRQAKSAGKGKNAAQWLEIALPAQPF